MTESEKTQLQNWAYWLEQFCEDYCFGRKGTCVKCAIPIIVKQIKERVEKK